MRKVLLFLTIFGIGLAALLYLMQRQERPERSSFEAGTRPAGEPFTEIPLAPDEQGGEGGTIPVLIQGPIDVTQFESAGVDRKPIRRLHADDSQALGGNLYVLRGMRIEILDPATGKTTAKLASPRTRLKIDLLGGKPSFGEDDKAVLSDVEATLYEQAPVVPLTFEIKDLEYRMAENRLISQSPVKISGPGLQANGAALDADLATGQFVLPTSGSIDLVLPNEVRVTLKATGAGPIDVSKSVVDGRDQVRVVASGGARLAATGAEPLQLDATEITLLARSRVAEGGTGTPEFLLDSIDALGSVVAVSRGDTFKADEAKFNVTPEGHVQRIDLHGSVAIVGGQGSVRGNHALLEFVERTGRPSRAHVEGDVVLQRGEDVFRSRSADFDFDSEGQLSKATLVGDPTGRVAIGQFLPPDQLELRAAHAELTGPGPLVLEFGDRTKVELTGPGDLKIPETDLAIHAERSLVGEAQADQKTGTITADGAVKVTWGGDDLESERVTLSTSQNESGETIVDAATTGATTIHRTLPDGAKATLAASDGLETHSVGKKLVVTLARGVDLSAEGPSSFRARAATVKDFDWEARAFVAEGDVAFESERGSGSADRIVARGLEDIELTGSANRPARFSRLGGAEDERFEEAKIEGLTIHARADSLDAIGDVESEPPLPVKTDFSASDAAYHLEGGEVHVEYDPPPPGADPAGGAARPFRAFASSSVRAWVQTPRGESTLSCDALRVFGSTKARGKAGDAGAEDRPGIVASDVRADGAVVLDWNAQGGIAGVGDHFVLDPEGRGRLSADPGRRVRASGRLTTQSPPYDLDAEWIEFDPERLEGRDIDMRLQAGAPRVPGLPEEAKPLLAYLSADHLLATPEEMVLEGNAHVDGISENAEPWSIDAGSVRVVGNFREKKFSPADFEVIQAWDGFDARLGIRGRVMGTRIESKAGTIRLEGQPAELHIGPVAVRSAWIEYGTENMLLATDKGVIGPVEGGAVPWSITYEALQPFDREDKTILALRNPVYVKAEDEIRASWMLFWVDREEWQRSGRKAVSASTSGPDLRVRVPEEASQGPPKDPGAKKQRDSGKLSLAKISAAIAELRADPMSKILSEAYVGGNLEWTESGARRARASAIYLDIVEGHGWVRDADFLPPAVGIRGREQQMRIRAEWMRVSSDLSLRADRATLTFCSYDEPHYVVETGDLRLEPNPGGRLFYNISATRNALRFANGWAIPLPPLLYAEDEEGNPIIENLNLGQSAKFGASIGASFNFGLGRIGSNIGRVFGKILSLPKDSVKGHWSFHADFLGSRGLLLGTGLELKSGDEFQLDAEFSAIPDGNKDKGLVRVDEDERSTLRDWFRARGRYTVSRREWWELALSIQNDPGVQSEFFEGDFLRYEQKDNFLHWRKADEAWLYNASAKVLLEDRTDTEELPKVAVIRGRAPVTSIGGLDVLHTGYLDAAYLRRREGGTSFVEPGDPIPRGYGPYPDGLGEREVARMDTEQRFEAPFSLGFAGLRATPWVSGRATLWDQGVDPDDSPQRAGAFAGFDLSTTFWRYYGSNVIHALAPFASVHGDFASSESGGDPVRFDAMEDSPLGRFVDVGLRSRVWNLASKARFDAEIRATHAEDLPNGQPDGFQPVGVLAELLTWMGGVPVGLTHDGRYDVEDPATVYSRTFLGSRVHPKWDIELGYHRGVDAADALLYEAISAATRYRATRKWEIELAETISTSSNEDLASSFLLRRLGHDFVTEIELGYTAGEGSRFSINLSPLLTSKPSSLGLMDRWLGQ
ncbi:MAG: hypothetical protein ACKVXR_02715 [Planctomycetota bacterium]